MRHGKSLGRALDLIEEAICIVLVGLLLLVTFNQIIFRYILNSPLSWSEELARLGFVWLSFFGASLAARRKAHISFDLITSFLSCRTKAAIALLMDLLIVIFLLLVIPHTLRLVALMNTVPSAGLGWPMGIFYLCVPLATLLIVRNLIREIVSGLRTIRTGEANG